jgi:hypothetical protein
VDDVSRRTIIKATGAVGATMLPAGVAVDDALARVHQKPKPPPASEKPSTAPAPVEEAAPSHGAYRPANGGASLLIGGSMIWVALMVINMASWKRDHPGKPVPLAMFAITATAILWAWATSGVLIELLGVLLPRAFGLTNLIDAGLGRTLFSVALHGIAGRESACTCAFIAQRLRALEQRSAGFDAGGL